MPEPITNAELARRLDDRFADLRDDLHEVNNKIEKLVSREVYDAHRAALDERVKALEGKARWLITGFIAPIVLIVIQWVLAAKGVKP